MKKLDTKKLIYDNSLLTKEWNIKILKIKKRDKNKCQKCGSKIQLQVHHKWYYKTLTEAYDYPDECLITLCSKCHGKIDHDKIKEDKNLKSGGSLKYLNIISEKNNKPLSKLIVKNGKYKIGQYQFKTKTDIKIFNRKMLKHISENGVDGEKKFITNKKYVDFCQDLFKHHYSYNNQNFAKYIHVKLDCMNQNSNFVVVFEDGSETDFSSNKCISNL